MSPTDTLARMISERERDIAELQAELDVLRAGLTVTGDGAEPAYRPMRAGGRKKAPRSRQDMLRKLVKDAGRAGLTRHEVIAGMAAICDSPANSISSMLTILGRKGLIRPSPEGRWRATR